jgi:hypothetical protein
MERLRPATRTIDPGAWLRAKKKSEFTFRLNGSHSRRMVGFAGAGADSRLPQRVSEAAVLMK